MNALCAVVLFAALAAVNASTIALGHAGILGLGHAGVDSAAVLAGPSGTVVRSGHGVLAAPAIAAPLAIGHAGIVGHGLLGHSLVVPAGHGLEGQWIPDINEKLYDDGSYKPHVYGW